MVRIGTGLDTKTVDELRLIAQREDRSIASVIRRAVEREIELQNRAA